MFSRAGSLVLAAGLAVLALSGCGGSESAATNSSTSTTASTASTTTSSTTTAAPVDYPTALTQRLAKELDDPAVAAQVVERLGPEFVTSMESKIPLAEVATSPHLAYIPERTADNKIDSLVIFAFGYRDAPDGSRLPGPANEAMATAVEKFVKDRPMPIYAQHEVAKLLQVNKVPDVVSIEPVVGADGKTVYLSTAGVAEDIVKRAGEAKVDLGTVGVVCFADHVVRCVETAKAAGMDATVPESIDLPTEYDPESAQAWTRDRVSYVATDLTSRMASIS